MKKQFHVGIAGANAERGWARDAHLDALRALPGFTITAISARTQDIADHAARHFGAAAAYADSLEMVRDTNVDVIAITVKVPEHRAIVLAALQAGKHVYCEWPLGRGLAEAREMLDAVPPRIHAVIGLQGLQVPAVRAAVALLRSGAIGAPRTLRLFGSAGAWGHETTAFNAYLQDRITGATMETIGGGHNLALAEALAGAYTEVDARCTTFLPNVPVMGTDKAVPRSCADHMLVLGRHETGCVSTFEIIGRRPKTKTAHIELECESGWLRLTGVLPGMYQTVPLTLEASVPVQIPEAAVLGLQGPAANVTEIWAGLNLDLHNGTFNMPGFAEAVRLSALLAAIDRASMSGKRQYL